MIADGKLNVGVERVGGYRLNVDREGLIGFFDEREDVRPHASAVKGVAGEELGRALLVKYFRQLDPTAEMLRESCTTGQKKGYRLDGWLRTSIENTPTLLQVEVKTWSRHSLDGKSLLLNASPAEVSAYKIERWDRYWSGSRFREDGLNKVLTPMRSPCPGLRVEPLACLWDAVHPNGAIDALFSVPIDEQQFRRVFIFSMSAFLRNIPETILRIDLPSTQERIRLLNQLFR